MQESMRYRRFHQGPGIQIAKIKTHKESIDKADLNRKSQGGKNQFHIVASWVPQAWHNIWPLGRLKKQWLINVENNKWQASTLEFSEHIAAEHLVNRGLRKKKKTKHVLTLTTTIWSPLTEGASGTLSPSLIACASYFDWVGHQGPRRLNRKISISLCPYSATDGSSAKHFIVTLKPNNIFQGKWLANSHHLWCRKIPTSLSGLNASKETLKWRSLYNQSDFFHPPFVEISFTQGLKEKIRRRKSKEKENLP